MGVEQAQDLELEAARTNAHSEVLGARGGYTGARGSF